VSVTVEQLAKKVGMTPQALMSTLSKVGIDVSELTSPQAILSAAQQQKLQDHFLASSKLSLSVKKKPLASPFGVGKKSVVVIKKLDLSEARAKALEASKKGGIGLVEKKVDEEVELLSVSKPPSEARVEKKDIKQVVGKKKFPDKNEPLVTSELTDVNQAAEWMKAAADAALKRKGAFDFQSLSQKFSRPVESAQKSQDVSIGEATSVAELAQKMQVKTGWVIKVLMKMGVMATVNEVLDQDTAVLVVEEMGHRPILIDDVALEESLLEGIVVPLSGERISRPPIVTIMGHVDHGKTTLLDTIRKARVASGESGGITQHIGAYQFEASDGRRITFLDTPGHEAFTAMRARGAQCTDIVVLIVAADDGVMPQTKEAIVHARAAAVPIIVAVNKIDKSDANLDRVKQALADQNVLTEDWGGDIMFYPVSAKVGTGIDALLEGILLQSEMLELKAHPTGSATGLVIEARMEKGLGPIATLLVLEGSLEPGQVILVGREYGRVRMMMNDRRCRLKKAGPSMPVEVQGLSGLPDAGDAFVTVIDEKHAKEVADFRKVKHRKSAFSKKEKVSMDNVLMKIKNEQISTLNVVIKADVQGSVEAIVESLQKLSNTEVSVRVISSGVGAITESDVNLVLASEALLIGFNVRADVGARAMIEKEKINVYYYNVIYHLLEEVRSALQGMLKPLIKETVVGMAEVKEVFKVSKQGVISGCFVVEGSAKKKSKIRVIRDHVVIYDSEVGSLRHYKDDVNEVRSGSQCGVGVVGYSDIKVGDVFEFYTTEEVMPSLEK
jgi:translation initiation factor IF-2